MGGCESSLRKKRNREEPSQQETDPPIRLQGAGTQRGLRGRQGSNNLLGNNSVMIFRRC